MSDSEALEICRSCLLPSNEIYPIFQTVFEDDLEVITILNCFSLEVQENDDLPKSICHPCLTKLQDAFIFIETFRKSQEILRELPDKVENQHDECVSNDVDFSNSSETKLPDSTIREKMEDTEENAVNTYGDNDDTPDSEDENYLIEKSVKLTALCGFGFFRENVNDTDSEGNQDVVEGENNDQTQEKEVTALNPSTLETFTCSICPKTFHKYRTFSMHIRKHKQAIYCHICSKDYATPVAFLNHYRWKHRHYCKICGKIFYKREDWTQHMHTHDALPKYYCAHCPKKFSANQSLKSHYLTVHSGIRNFLCNLCGDSFKNCDNLRYHIKKNHSKPEHVCSVCGKTFVQGTHLKDHVRRHLGIRPHKCTKCGKGFLYNNMLRKHDRICGKPKWQRLNLSSSTESN